ncbi:hypothetical protein LE181_18020 [Streptomyces sp. SCA3-4]|uniref:hypothetical protein n=1 Tax=Streptomyces sichuanensis TaxID=2871810 RepID=UPI001CE2985F|nr:hypothetical protein [Streptomyces sichuanensis]MCA6094050.1 hypothetical protein [Streptomyces sichuanensis]
MAGAPPDRASRHHAEARPRGLVLATGLVLGRDRRDALGAVERPAAGGELAVHGGDGDAQGG